MLAGDLGDALAIVGDLDARALGLATVPIGYAVDSADRQIDVDALHVGLTAACTRRQAELLHRPRPRSARGFACLGALEVVFISAATSPDELLATAEMPIVVPSGESSVTRTDDGRRLADVIDDAPLPRAAVSIAVAPDPDALARLSFGPVDAQLVGLAIRVVEAIIAHALLDDLDACTLGGARIAVAVSVRTADGGVDRRANARLDRYALARLACVARSAIDDSAGIGLTKPPAGYRDICAFRLARVEVRATIFSTHRLEDAYARATGRHGDTHVASAVVSREAIAHCAATHWIVAPPPVGDVARIIGCFLDGVRLAVHATNQAPQVPDVAGFSLAATSKHQQDHPTTTTPPHVSLLIRWLDPSNAATTMPARKASNFKHGSTCGCATSRHLEGEHPQKFPSPSIC